MSSIVVILGHILIQLSSFMKQWESNMVIFKFDNNISRTLKGYLDPYLVSMCCLQICSCTIVNK